ncbi:MAG TPA: HypC/HybG/HupF family hydrogenase formation chaperone [Candidatus Omnitrophota bacterium]|nr:HypC/HybG/HupF family hydrogenase formation chaperone [Candidatus Omnitrophota bacterium]
MCLAVPMKVIKVDGHICVAGSGGLRRSANISFLKNVKKGDYILIHAGFAIEKVKPGEAARTLKALKNLH